MHEHASGEWEALWCSQHRCGAERERSDLCSAAAHSWSALGARRNLKGRLRDVAEGGWGSALVQRQRQRDRAVHAHVGEGELELVSEVAHLHGGVAAAVQILAQPQ